MISDLDQNITLVNFQQLKSHLNFSSEHFFFLAFSRFITVLSQFLETAIYDDLETFLMKETYRTHFTSAFYSSLYAHSSSTLSAIEKWEADLNNQYTEEESKGTISIVRFTFTCNHQGETQYKILHCLYIGPNAEVGNSRP